MTISIFMMIHRLPLSPGGCHGGNYCGANPGGAFADADGSDDHSRDLSSTTSSRSSTSSWSSWSSPAQALKKRIYCAGGSRCQADSHRFVRGQTGSAGKACSKSASNPCASLSSALSSGNSNLSRALPGGSRARAKLCKGSNSQKKLSRLRKWMIWRCD
ncbi:hypothetical protein CBR_g45610 [Chara braunii]|uniref:Uncharacterized protein n=1 Tax=Chara braunii TaxID=69332 RepID=A0A388LZ92_CHABU|nr:hypothetical protein CBR_g45610 [Chara braunii]|eukprot:GBG87552.1 hypothetical protein CBR_g45610 [Chara braunii]